MKSTDNFTKTIQIYLNNRAEQDELFAETLKKENKNIDDCVTYILNQVKASGCSGFTDDEIFGMAVHYYDEDDVKPGKKIKANVVVNHHVELTEEEKAQAKQKALDEVVAKEKERLTSKTKKKKEEKKETEQGTLF